MSYYYQRGRDAMNDYIVHGPLSRSKCGQHFMLTSLRAVLRHTHTPQDYRDVMAGYHDRMREWETELD